ncbi:ORF128 RR2A [Cydia pomonella granulovirus]|uniref:ribonucleoside-diphosphate reductase n=2 Tax=Cydia pomonella granulosis virus TaxID=28289 RepID=Q91ES7_GVCPM|nr:ORF128 RR2A [Cydia pomonella granulovirus]AAK70788.1 ORF128 RR2A [Cydia pomonella granulovirus]AIU37054.1 ORF128 rr2a [Cydia pomonella granulovirus]QGY99433.1 RR2a [Cydia pomonella granulovirus]QGY99575.1 RR2a [Cydia pomonella granulovirus]QGY99717.1 RR2a [Cydia pomonella granulovirus]
MDRVYKWFDDDKNCNNDELPTVQHFNFTTVHTDNRLKIWPPTYTPSWNYLVEHQINHWYANEHKPMDDLNGFDKIDSAWQNALLQSFAVLAIGDDKVMDLISNSDIEWEESTKWMFADQAARETTHKIVYNRMLELACVSRSYTVNTLTSGDFSHYIMDCRVLDEFQLPERNEVNDKVLFLSTMILCERYLFAAPFLIINLMGESGFINKCVKINMQVMKDEHVHYKHAVQLLMDLKRGVTNEVEINELFRGLSGAFMVLVESMVMKICIDLTYQQKISVLHHTRFTLRDIFVTLQIEPPPAVVQYTITPFKVFDKNCGEDKFNLMESTSTVYNASNSIYYPAWDVLDEEMRQEMIEETKRK